MQTHSTLFGLALIMTLAQNTSYAQNICDRSAGEKLYFSGGEIQDEPILEGLQIMRTNVAGPTVSLLCESQNEQVLIEKICKPDVGDVRIFLAADGAISVECVRHTAPLPMPKPIVDEEPNAKTLENKKEEK